MAVVVCLAGAPVGAQEFELAPADHIAPQIRHDRPARAATAGQPLTIEAIITDNVVVERATVHYRPLGSTDYREIRMMPTVGDRYAAVINGRDVFEPGIEYYIQAEDAAGNSAMRAFSFSPLTVVVEPPGAARPATGSMATGPAVTGPGAAGTAEGPKPWYKKPVVWAVVGGVAVAAAVAGGGGGGGGGGSSTGTIVIGTPVP